MESYIYKAFNISNEVIIAFLVCFILQLVISYMYTTINKQKNSVQAFLFSLVIIGNIICMLVQLIIENNIVGIALVGVMVGIGFKNVLNNPLDITFIFFSIIIAFLCGCNLFIQAVIVTLIMSIMIALLNVSNFGYDRNLKKTLKIIVDESMNYMGLFDEVFEKYLKNYNIISIKTIHLGTMVELTYLIEEKEISAEKQFIDELRTRNGNLGINITIN